MLLNMPIADVGTRVNLPKPAETSRAKKFSSAPADNRPESTGSKTTKTDNTHPVSEQNETDTGSSQDFDSTFDEKIKIGTKTQPQAEKKNENKSDKAAPATPSAQPFALDELIAASLVHAKTSTTVPLAGQIGKPLITKPVIIKPVIARPVITQPVITKPVITQPVITKPVITESVSTKPDITKPVITKPVITKPDITNPVITNPVITKPVITKPVITKPDITKPEQTTPENIGKPQVSVNAPVVSDKIADPDKTAVSPSEKVVIKDGPVITSEPKPDPQSGKARPHATPAAPINNNKITAGSEELVAADKPLVADSPKTQLSNATVAASPDQSSHSQQKVLIGQGGSAPAAEQVISNTADTGRKDRHSKTELFELPENNAVQAKNLSVKSITPEMTQSQIQSSALQVENRGNLPGNQVSNTTVELGEQLISSNSTQPAAAEQSPESTAFTKIAGNTNSSDSVSTQIQESIHSSLNSNNQQIVIRLDPPELGKVAIKFTEQGNDITGVLQVERVQTRDQIQQALPEIIQNLQDSGIQIKRIEVVLSNQQEQYSAKDQSSTAGQGNFSGQQGSQDPELQRNNSDYAQWLTNTDNIAEYMQPQIQLTENSVNVLI